MGILLMLLAVSLVVAFHEFGHLTVAKLFGVRVTAYSIGFGKILFHKKLGDTEYRLSLIPLGGYCKMLSQAEIDNTSDQDKSKTFESKPYWQKIAIFLAGPVSNVLLAFFLLLGGYLIYGVPELTGKIGEVVKDSPAEKAGLKPGDEIASIICLNQDSSIQEIKVIKTWDDVAGYISQQNCNRLNIVVGRNGGINTFIVKPIISNSRKVIGIVPSDYIFTHDWKLAFKTSKDNINSGFVLMADFVKGFNRKTLVSDNVIGPVGIVSTGHQTYKHFGIFGLIVLSAGISLSLAFMNLLPFIFILDGGQAFLLIIEWIIGRPFGQSVRTWLMWASFVVIIALSLFVLQQDIFRLIGK